MATIIEHRDLAGPEAAPPETSLPDADERPRPGFPKWSDFWDAICLKLEIPRGSGLPDIYQAIDRLRGTVAQTIEAEQFCVEWSTTWKDRPVGERFLNQGGAAILNFATAFSAHQNLELTRELKAAQSWRSMGIIEIAVENQSVSDYIDHWGGRTLKAESELASLREEIERMKRK